VSSIWQLATCRRLPWKTSSPPEQNTVAGPSTSRARGRQPSCGDRSTANPTQEATATRSKTTLNPHVLASHKSGDTFRTSSAARVCGRAVLCSRAPRARIRSMALPLRGHGVAAGAQTKQAVERSRRQIKRRALLFHPVAT
jgi:hypothetical protein